jgi:hypothetical protein
MLVPRPKPEEDPMDYPLLDVMWSMVVFFSWVLWLWLLIAVYTDMFRRPDIGGWAKTAWVLVTLLVPFIGVFVYLITQGRGMGERRADLARAQRTAMDDHIRSVAAAGSTGADELAKARDLLDRGVITGEEYATMKRKVLA